MADTKRTMVSQAKTATREVAGMTRAVTHIAKHVVITAKTNAAMSKGIPSFEGISQPTIPKSALARQSTRSRTRNVLKEIIQSQHTRSESNPNMAWTVLRCSNTPTGGTRRLHPDAGIMLQTLCPEKPRNPVGDQDPGHLRPDRLPSSNAGDPSDQDLGRRTGGVIEGKQLAKDLRPMGQNRDREQLAR